MDKTIYSYELDSVCNSQKEMTYALDKFMYETIALNGDRIVLTFNQLSDSKFVMSLLNDDAMKEVLIGLLRQQKIVVSQFIDKAGNTISTAVRYIKGNISKYKLNKENFIFSSVDFLNDLDDKIKESVLDNLEEALLYCDLNFLYSKLKSSEYNFSDNEINFLINYVDFLIRVSLSDIKYLPLKESNKKYSFTKCIDIAISALKSFQNKALSNEIAELYNYVLTNIPEKSQKRSDWINCINHNSCYKKEIETVLNVCYNLAVESSISGIESIASAQGKERYFFEKYKETLAFYGEYDHSFLADTDENKSAASLYEFSFLQKQYWESVVRIIDKSQMYNEYGLDWSDIIKKIKRKRIGTYLFVLLATTFIILLINGFLDAVSDIFNEAITFSIDILAFIFGILLNAVVIFLATYSVTS